MQMGKVYLDGNAIGGISKTICVTGRDLARI